MVGLNKEEGGKSLHRSYSNAAKPITIIPSDPSTGAVDSTSFYGASSSPTLSTSNSTAKTYNKPPPNYNSNTTKFTPKVSSATTHYIESVSDGDDDDLEITAPTASYSKGSGGSGGSGDAKENYLTRRRDSNLAGASVGASYHAASQSRLPPSTSPAAISSERSTMDISELPLTGSNFDPPEGVLSIPFNSVPNNGSLKDFEGTGWITPKIVALGNTATQGIKLGLYETSLWDVEILDTPTIDEFGIDVIVGMEDGIKVQSSSKIEGYRPMGCWMQKPRSQPVDVNMDEIDQLIEEDLDLEPPPIKHSYRTITREELDSIKPHPNSYFSRNHNSWTIFTSKGKPSISPFFVNDSNNHSIEVWRTLRTQLFKPSYIDISAPPQPVSPYDLDEDILVREWSETRPSLMKLVSTKGKEIIYSELDYYPSVIPDSLYKKLLELRSEPTPGQSSRLQAGMESVQFIWKALDVVLFKGNRRNLSVDGRGFRKHMPFDNVTKMIFIQVLGFEFQESDEIPAGSLKPPSLDDRTEEGIENRRRLLRCWLEIGTHLQDYKLRYPTFQLSFPTRVTIKPAADAMRISLGGDNFPRIPKEAESNGWQVVSGTKKPNDKIPLAESIGAREYHNLGVVPDVTDDVLIQVYTAQVENSPHLIPFYLNYIDSISKLRSSQSLDLLRIIERSKGRYSSEDLDEAYNLLNSVHGYYISDESLWDSYTSLVQDLDLASIPNSAKKHELYEAMQLIASNRNSDYLKVMLQSVQESRENNGFEVPKMDLKKALKVLELEDSVDDDSLMMVYTVRIGDASTDTEKASMKEAAIVIAQTLHLPMSLKMLEVGSTSNNSGWEMPYVSPDRPVGLTNIANTCYLNSLLQFFFTVRELREAILGFAENPAADNQLEELRVGGRLVTKREIERSKRFVVHLQMLFNQLIYTPSSSVTPETELAYLALVPSKDEESKEAELKTAASTSELPPAKSNISMDNLTSIQTDSDIMIDPGLLDASLNKPTPPTVLGKRGSGHLDTSSELTLDGMAIDSSDDNSSAGILATSIASPSSSFTDERSVRRRGTPPDNSNDDLIAVEVADGTVEIHSPKDIEMQSLPLDASSFNIASLPPPLPPRSIQSTLEQEVSTYMAFGRQNDVTECADNVLFQIECALSANSPNAETNNVLNRTFYGKMRQRLEIDDPLDGKPVRIMEEKFSYLLVDVAEEGRDIYDGLDTVFDDAMVDIEGKQARRRISLDDVPPILQIQLQRVQYDRTEQKIFKSNAHLSFPAVLSVDRYLEIDPTDLESLAKKEKTNEVRKALEVTRTRYKELKKYKSSDVSETLKKAYSHLSNQPDLSDVVSLEMAEDTINEANLLDEEVTHLEATIKNQREEMEKIWSGNQTAVYELVSVFIHRGTALSGHYFIYQRDCKKPDSWLKYNDSQVTDINADEVFKSSGDTNAYFLVYCRRDRLDAISSVRDVQLAIHPLPELPALVNYPTVVNDDDMMGTLIPELQG